MEGEGLGTRLGIHQGMHDCTRLGIHQGMHDCLYLPTRMRRKDYIITVDRRIGCAVERIFRCETNHPNFQECCFSSPAGLPCMPGESAITEHSYVSAKALISRELGEAAIRRARV